MGRASRKRLRLAAMPGTAAVLFEQALKRSAAGRATGRLAPVRLAVAWDRAAAANRGAAEGSDVLHQCVATTSASRTSISCALRQMIGCLRPAGSAGQHPTTSRPTALCL